MNDPVRERYDKTFSGGTMFVLPSLLIAVSISVVGQLIVKRGLNQLGDLEFSKGLIYAFSRILFSYHVILGTLIYFVAIFPWLYAIAKVDLSYAYPFLALSYVEVIFLSWLFLGESIPPLRWMGVLVICCGVFLIAKS